MAGRRRYLVHSELTMSWTPEFAEQQQAALSACPEAARFSDEEAEEFLLAALTYDFSEKRDLGRAMRKHGIAYPTELAYDEYRLARYLFRRWESPEFRSVILDRVLRFNPGSSSSLLRRKPETIMEFLRQYRYAGGMAGLRKLGLCDLIDTVKAGLSPEQMRQYQAVVRYGKVKLHQVTTEPEPARAPTRWEQQKLLRRLHLRQVQMHSLKRSLRQVRKERKSLVARLRLLQTEIPQLRRLAEQLEAVGMERSALESRHAEALALQQREHEAEVQLLAEKLAAIRADYAQTLALREHLLPVRKG